MLMTWSICTWVLPGTIKFVQCHGSEKKSLAAVQKTGGGGYFGII